MKIDAARLRTIVARPPADLRLLLLFGPDEAGAAAQAAAFVGAMGAGVERVDMDGAMLRADPARLADEAASLSLFGDRRVIRVTAMGEESLGAVTALFEAQVVASPVVAIAPSIRTTGALAKAAIASPLAAAFACYPPDTRQAAVQVVASGRELNLTIDMGLAERIVASAGGDRAVIDRELRKYADYLDAGADRPATVTFETMTAIGAAINDAAIANLIERIVARDAIDVAAALRRVREAGDSPIPWLRTLARRLSSLADMRGDLDRGDAVGEVMKRHRVFWKEERQTAAALDRWTSGALAEAHRATRLAEREVLRGGAAGPIIAERLAMRLVR